MDKIKRISYDELTEIASDKGFIIELLLKDYYITSILYLLRDQEGIFFKGGTALQKIFLDYSRLSEDIDFTITDDKDKVKKKIISILEESRLFEKITKDKDVEGFIRLVIHYQNFSKNEDVMFIDLNERAKLFLKPEKYQIKHFYKNFIPEFSFNTLSKEELIAEKIAAAIARNQPRDHYDIYKIIKEKMTINIEMVREKCKQSNVEFNIIKMFNKAKKLKKRWDEDLLPLLSEEISFQEVMTTLATYFRLKEEKIVRR